ncbi:hypothetical protein HPB47_017251 [Ixodes persulcatus]|uniref:Uncharacterized protein n=1 Tax=Ixodes persulcatus TaxID=34615 RepID=A0AC60R0V7_IXOPE|nr:hypothetical protein HPB47_017251 [Ixodes persulcatus]
MKCETRKLKRGATPSVFEEYIEYVQPSAKKPRSGTAVRKREAAVLRPSLAAPSTSKQHTSKSLLHGGNDSFEMCTNVPSGDSRDEVEPSAAEGPTKDEGTQVDVRSAVSVVERQKWRRRERDLKSQVDRLKQTVGKYKEELKNLKEDCHLSAFGKKRKARLPQLRCNSATGASRSHLGE